MAAIAAPPGVPTEKRRPSACSAFFRQLDFERLQKKDFPNLFLPAHLRDVDPALLSPVQRAELRKVLDEVRASLEAALGTVFDRLVIPLQLPGKVDPSAERFFSVARQMAREVDPTAEIAPSGGVVRSALGYLYEEMLRESERNPSFNAIEFLKKIARGEHSIFDRNGNVMAFDVRGVGSDFDVLIDGDPKFTKSIENKIGALFRKHGVVLDQGADPDDFNKAFFTIADLKPATEQIDRSVRQGGASTDLLLYDFGSRRLREPAEVPGIVDDLLQGRYRYLPPRAGATRDDPAVTTMRGPRALLELPFLSLRAADQKVLNDELRSILRNIHERGIYPEEKAINQINKLRRNARLSMANNAILNAPPNSTLGLLRSIARALEYRRKAQLLDFPTEIHFESYTPRYPLGVARLRLAEDLPAALKSYLIPGDKFLASFTDDGVIYHGTSGQGALGILRGGFRQSDYELGIRRGTYSTADIALAKSYSDVQDSKLLLTLPVKKDQPFQAFDARALGEKGTIALRRIEAEARAQGSELADWLAKRYGVDFILLSGDQSISLIKNIEALERTTLPALAKDVVARIHRGMKEAEPDFAQLLLDRQRLEDSAPLFRALAIDVGPVPSKEAMIEQAIANLPRTQSAAKIIQLIDLLPAERAAKLTAKDLGGRNLADLMLTAFSEDPAILRGVYSAGLPDVYGAISRDPNLSSKIIGAVEKIVREINEPITPSVKKFQWLLGLERIIRGLDRDLPGIEAGEARRLLSGLDEQALATLRKDIAQNPILFDGAPELEADLRLISGRNLDLTGDAVESRLKQIETSRSLIEKLRGVEMLNWVANLSPAKISPRIQAALRTVAPLVKEPEDLFSSATKTLLESLPPDRELNELAVRSLQLVRRTAPNIEAISTMRDPKFLFRSALGVLDRSAENPDPNLLAEIRKIDEYYSLKKHMPGVWPHYEQIFTHGRKFPTVEYDLAEPEKIKSYRWQDQIGKTMNVDFRAPTHSPLVQLLGRENVVGSVLQKLVPNEDLFTSFGPEGHRVLDELYREGKEAASRSREVALVAIRPEGKAWEFSPVISPDTFASIDSDLLRAALSDLMRKHPEVDPAKIDAYTFHTHPSTGPLNVADRNVDRFLRDDFKLRSISGAAVVADPLQAERPFSYVHNISK